MKRDNKDNRDSRIPNYPMHVFHCGRQVIYDVVCPRYSASEYMVTFTDKEQHTAPNSVINLGINQLCNARSFVHSNGSSEIRFLKSGTYVISYQVIIKRPYAATTPTEIAFIYNGVELPRTKQVWTAHAAGHQAGNYCQTIIQANAGSILQLSSRCNSAIIMSVSVTVSNV